MSDLLSFILRVASEQKPYITHIGLIDTDTGQRHEIVSLWAGVGIEANPIKRIEELSVEINKLKNPEVPE